MQEDKDVNEWSDAWAEFRRALAEGERESLESVVSRRNIHIASDSEDEDAVPGLDSSAGSTGSHALGVSYAGLTTGERNDILGWNTRIAREEVFGRYYFPKHWELRELQTIKKFLELADSNQSLNESLKFTVSLGFGSLPNIYLSPLIQVLGVVCKMLPRAHPGKSLHKGPSRPYFPR